MKKVLMLINDTTYAYNLRGAIIRRLINEGYEVIVACKFLEHKDKLEDMGCRLIEVNNDRHGTNPLADFKIIKLYRRILKTEKPDVVLTYNIKPNSYGGMMCNHLRIAHIPNVTGLGTPLENKSKIQKLAIFLYKMGVKDSACVFFQNHDNKHFFEERKMLPGVKKTRVLPGSGVDLELHQIFDYPEDDMINFLFVARVMKEKGIDIYLKAAKKIHEEYPDTMFHICGMCDDPAYIEILKRAEQQGYIKYHGEQADMRPFFKMAHCIVHPSYYPEGMSNVLLEAAAHARPIIATDRAGCRETVADGISGFVVPVRDEKAVINAIRSFIQLSKEAKRQMGLHGRIRMKQIFDREYVVKAYMEEINEIIGA